MDEEMHKRFDARGTTGIAVHGPTVRALRERLGVSQERLAQRAGLTMQTISRIERGAVTVSHPLTVKAVAEALDVEARLIIKS